MKATFLFLLLLVAAEGLNSFLHGRSGAQHLQPTEEVHTNPSKGQGPKLTGKPLMDTINVMRTRLCWSRPNLMQHEKCLKFLGIKCKQQSTGEGICSEFRDKVTDECLGDMDEEDLEKEDPAKLRLHKLQCEIAEDLGPLPSKTDSDGDGVPDSKDAFPQDPTEWEDSDGDGLGNNADPDDDNDGVMDSEDTFPLDPKEQKDSDGDGIGDNTDPDDDNDGVPDSEDAFPYDPTETHDLDGDGIGDNKDPDIDGDGVPNEEDMDPWDPSVGRKKDTEEPQEVVENEPVDSDGDGVPDHEDKFPQDPKESADRDGDGYGDNSDAFPDDGTEWLDSDGDGVGDNKDAFPQDPSETADSDGDGYGDNSDHFPSDPTEWVDTDGDGVGDNADHYPLDPNCHSDPCILKDGSLAPAAVFSPAPGPAPLLVPKARGGVPAKTGGHNLQPVINPWELNKVERGLPEQGYNEWSRGVIADHEDGKTFNGDWGNEFHHEKGGYDEAAALKRACELHPENKWCQHKKVAEYSSWNWPFAA